MGQKRHKASNLPELPKEYKRLRVEFSEDDRTIFLKGIRNARVKRRQKAAHQLEKDIKKERVKLKHEAKERLDQLIYSNKKRVNFLKEDLFNDKYEDKEVTVSIKELDPFAMATENNWVGPNPNASSSVESINESDEPKSEYDPDELPGMELTKKKKKGVVKEEKSESNTEEFDSVYDIKKTLKKEALERVQQSKLYQIKDRKNQAKQKKKSRFKKDKRLARMTDKPPSKKSEKKKKAIAKIVRADRLKRIHKK